MLAGYPDEDDNWKYCYCQRCRKNYTETMKSMEAKLPQTQSLITNIEATIVLVRGNLQKVKVEQNMMELLRIHILSTITWPGQKKLDTVKMEENMAGMKRMSKEWEDRLMILETRLMRAKALEREYHITLAVAINAKRMFEEYDATNQEDPPPPPPLEGCPSYRWAEDYSAEDEDKYAALNAKLEQDYYAREAQAAQEAEAAQLAILV